MPGAEDGQGHFLVLSGLWKALVIEADHLVVLGDHHPRTALPRPLSRLKGATPSRVDRSQVYAILILCIQH